MDDRRDKDDEIKNKYDYINPREMRLLHRNPSVIKANFQKLQKLGVYNIVKVSKFSSEKRQDVGGYLTSITEISGKTSRQIQVALGLPAGFLEQGADIYRINRIPMEDEFLPRGYTSMPDGLVLKKDLDTDSSGYPRGQMAWQVKIKSGVKISAILICSIQGETKFTPGVHPRTAMLYPENHPARTNVRK